MEKIGLPRPSWRFPVAWIALGTAPQSRSSSCKDTTLPEKKAQKMAQMQRYTTIPGVKIQAIYGLPPPILRHPARKSSTLHPHSSQAPRYAALHR